MEGSSFDLVGVKPDAFGTGGFLAGSFFFGRVDFSLTFAFDLT